MTLHPLRAAPPLWLGKALEQFEQQFHYPLGQSGHFHIAHGGAYLPFFAAMGGATVLVAEEHGTVFGTLVGVRRPLKFPDGSIQPATYLCDLKVRPGTRSGRTLLRLAQALDADWRAGGGVGGGYCVTMDGTSATPGDYSGRCGLPLFEKAGEITILKIATPDSKGSLLWRSSLDSVKAAFLRLTGPGFIPLGSSPTLRSQMDPIPLLTANGRACGLVEDTRRGKRLLTAAGHEMRAGHLSHFAFAGPDEGSALVRVALDVAAGAGLPALFLSLPRTEASALKSMLSDLVIVEAPATVYCSGLAPHADWRIHSSEI